ncbi:unnamed protein product [Sphenostylis stenocarpa]|uniref:J domain-containing protein n=1 Tax=Sphenostylis stenocarpa TaxID=92480 RepID=A0AA86SFG7_9FABA|nr:unnamed protein product [Sphenostylis stenocarpa]
MGIDYYKILEVDRSATGEDLKKAYKRQAKKWHPDKNLNSMEEAESMFRLISEAYAVLSDPNKRAIFDRYGENGVKGKLPTDDAGASGSGGCRGGAGGATPQSAGNGFGESFGSPGSGGGTRSKSSSRGRGVDTHASYGVPRKGKPIHRNLACTLEELYKGTTKRLRISRDVVDLAGNCRQVQEIVSIDVQAGWKKGTKITVPKKGNVEPNVTPADIVFTIDEKRHGVYTREGYNLVVTQKISLLEALTGYTVNLVTLDGRNLTVPINRVIHPRYEEVIAREGLPNPKNPTKKGSLKIRFYIIFPTELTLRQKDVMKTLLPA